MTDLEKLWERLRTMNRSLEEDMRQNKSDFMEEYGKRNTDDLYYDYIRIKAQQEQLNKIMEIVEGMMDDERAN